MINKLKLFFNKLFSDKRIVISSESYIRTIKFCKLSQLTIISVITILTLIFIVFFCFGIRLYSKVDSKQRKIDKMAQDGNLAKMEIVKMINHVDKINQYFEKIVKTSVVLKNISDSSKDIITTENDNKKLKLSEKDNTDYIEDSGLNLHYNDLDEKKKSTHKKIMKMEYDENKFDLYSIYDLHKILNSKIYYWYELIGNRYLHLQNLLSKLDLLNCKNNSWLSKAVSKAEGIIDYIGIKGNKSENDVLIGMKTQICNTRYIQDISKSYNSSAIMDLYNDATFLPSLTRLEEVIANIPIGNPLKGKVNFSSPFGYRIHPLHSRVLMHAGMDIASSYGAKVYATASGVVIKAGWNSGYGWSVDIAHKYGMLTRYAHLSHIDTRIGQKIYIGALIGRQGNSGTSTGSHLHYEIRINNLAINPKRFVKLSR